MCCQACQSQRPIALKLLLTLRTALWVSQRLYNTPIVCLASCVGDMHLRASHVPCIQGAGQLHCCKLVPSCSSALHSTDKQLCMLSPTSFYIEFLSICHQGVNQKEAAQSFQGAGRSSLCCSQQTLQPWRSGRTVTLSGKSA